MVKIKCITILCVIFTTLFMRNLYADDILKKNYDDILLLENNFFNKLVWKSDECGDSSNIEADKIMKKYAISCERASYYESQYIRTVYRLNNFNEVYQKIFLPLNVVVGEDRLTSLPSVSMETNAAIYIFYKDNLIINTSDCTDWLRKLDNGYIEDITTCYY